MSRVTPKEAGSEYFWYAKRESDRVLLLDHNGHVLGGSVSYSDIDTIVRAHNERIRAAYKCELAAPVAPLIPAPEQESAEPSDDQIFAKALEHGYGYFTDGKGRPFRKGDVYGEKMLNFIRDVLKLEKENGKRGT